MQQTICEISLARHNRSFHFECTPICEATLTQKDLNMMCNCNAEKSIASQAEPHCEDLVRRVALLPILRKIAVSKTFVAGQDVLFR